MRSRAVERGLVPTIWPLGDLTPARIRDGRLDVQDGVGGRARCSDPVCDSPFHWSHAYHITPYSHTQGTSVENNRPVCEADNLWRGNDIANETELARARVRRLIETAA
jgi:hypothetical protein